MRVASARSPSTTRPGSFPTCPSRPCAGRGGPIPRMPEGHTLRKLADDLGAAFAGRTVRVTSPQGRFSAEAAQVDGSRLVGAESAGKHLFVELEEERYVHVHLGLIGRFDVHEGVEVVPDPVAVRLRLVAVPPVAGGETS